MKAKSAVLYVYFLLRFFYPMRMQKLPPTFCKRFPIQKSFNVVVVSRHGVRSPTQSAENCTVGRIRSGRLGPLLLDCSHLAVLSCQSHVETQSQSRSFYLRVCPKPEDVQIIADVDERTRKTAEALNEGLYPTCGYKVKVTSSEHSAIFLR